MQERIKEHKRLKFSGSEHTNGKGHVPVWDRLSLLIMTEIPLRPYWYTCRVKEPIPIRLHPNNTNKGNGIEIPEAWMPILPKSITDDQ